MARQETDKVVLVVDDDGDSREIFRLALEHAGHTVVTATDGAEGLRKAKDHEPHLILMDIAMPVMDGYAALEQLRAQATTRDLPIVALTARASPHDFSELRRAGFTDMLLKPIAPVDVIAAVERSLARSG